MNVEIVKIHKDDAYYGDRKDLVGKKGELIELIQIPECGSAGFVSCEIELENQTTVFFAVMLKAAS